MIDRQDLRDAWQYVMLIAPAPLGALIGMRYATEQTSRARAFTWLCSCALGVIVGSWMGELLAPSAAGVAVATVVSAALGMEVMAGLATAVRSFAADPIAFLDRAVAIFRRGPP
jgi:hypothetical protein